MPDYPPLNWEDLYQSAVTPWHDGSPWAPLRRLVSEVCPQGGSILEVGYGYGVDAIHVASLGYRIKATDLSATAIRRARADAQLAGVQVDFQDEDFYTYTDEAKYDLVYEKGVLVNAHNAGMQDEFSRLTASKLRDGGHWISVSGNNDNLNSDRTGADERGYPRLSAAIGPRARRRDRTSFRDSVDHAGDLRLDSRQQLPELGGDFQKAARCRRLNEPPKNEV